MGSSHRAGVLVGVAVSLCFQLGAQGQATVDWSRQLQSTSTEQGRSVARDPLGNLIVGGYSDGTLFTPRDGSAFVARYDPSGLLLWGKHLPGSYVMNVAGDAGGVTYALGGTGSDVFLQKFDAAGTSLWRQQFGTNFTDQPNGISLDAAGNVYVSGRFDSGFSTQDAFVAKYNPAGSQVWLRRFGSTTADYANDVKVDPAGNVIVVGSTAGVLASGGGGGGGGDAFARKYDTNGNIVWTRQWGSGQSEGVTSAAVDAAGNVFVAGTTTGNIDGNTPNPFGDRHSFVTKLAADGSHAWTKAYVFGSEDYPLSIATDGDGDVFLAGAAYFGLTNQDFLIGEVDGDIGTLAWSQQFKTGADEWFTGIAVDPSGSKLWTSGYTTGIFNGMPSAGGNEDVLLAAFNVPEPSGAMLVAAAFAARHLRRPGHRAA